MSKLNYTPVDEIDKIHAELSNTFKSAKVQPIAYRKYVLLQLGYLLKDNVARFEDALMADLGKPKIEVTLTEIGPSISEIKDAYSNVEKWAKPEKPGFSMNYTPMRRVIYKQGKGIVLIISPFNYPINMSFGPIASAIAAGNTVVFKPSEQTPATSSLFEELFPKYVDPSVIRVVNGGVAETTKLLEHSWGHILFTGSGRVGRIIASAAGKTLTPVTLELGGKSPVFIDPKCDLPVAARRILWGKNVNAGQSCVAPDYILVPKDFQDKVVEALKATHDSFYPTPEDEANSIGKLVSPQAYNRISNLLKSTKGTIAFGGKLDEATRYIQPTVVKDVSFDDPLMSEELFGPVLPIVPVDNIDEAIDFVNAHDHPLALYVFTQDSEIKTKIINSTQSGAVCMNETMTHVAAEGLPFGGVGPSGSGHHNGKFGFNTFTHTRASLDPPGWLDRILSSRYPPYTDKKLKAISWLFPTLPARPTGPPAPTEDRSFTKWFLFALATVFAGLLTKRKISA
ncbi:NAD-aldehyde dehydrogenase [Desarmillaria tabescens]|uniref:Aldehyde dehydrogenase n=1 Tax=Armillaria tabescens TaxID=1929756 RepID=A0AA39KDQ9_ARMTA|nr:NAD-aldehyde dehydrogenase [Desarmillaria tabescens]KAK0458933.1 NAD-aldehyde dehydrogenase [Desarmillaria tabescens]